MGRVQLFYKNLSEIVGSRGFSVVTLTDAEEKRSLNVVCDKAITQQFKLRINQVPGHELMLPEVLLKIFEKDGVGDMELLVYDIVNGQYQTSLLNKRSLVIKTIRMSDAILLHFLSKIPLYIDDNLMARQSAPYQPETCSLSVPINSIDTKRLNEELEKAIAAEDYRLASFLHHELQKRQKPKE